MTQWLLTWMAMLPSKLHTLMVGSPFWLSLHSLVRTHSTRPVACCDWHPRLLRYVQVHTYSSAAVVAIAIEDERAGELEAGDDSCSGLDDCRVIGSLLDEKAELLGSRLMIASSRAPWNRRLGGVADSKDDILQSVASERCISQ